MSTTPNLIDQLRAMVALTNETPRIPALPRQLATEAANRLSELSAELEALRGKLAGVDEKALEAGARRVCSDGGFDPDEIMSNDGPRWKYYTHVGRTYIENYFAAVRGKG